MKTVYTETCTLHDIPREMLYGNFIEPHEKPIRATLILDKVKSRQLGLVIPPIDHGFEAMEKVHDKDYIDYLKTIHNQWVQILKDDPKRPMKVEEICVLPECIPHARLGKNVGNVKPTDCFGLPGYYTFDQSAGIGHGSWTAIYDACQVALTASDLLLSGDLAAFALCRPPGHHATPSLAGGYCYVNNAAVAIQYLIDESNSHVACLDIDFHHGNGTQSAFESKENPLYVSLHGKNQYPYYVGHEDEIGEGEGKGFNVNIPLPLGTTGSEYLAAMESKAFPPIKDFKPSFIVVSLGVDTFEGDILGGFNIKTQDYWEIGRAIGKLSTELNSKVLFVMEGGYVLEHIGDNVTNVLLGFENRK